MTTKTFLRPDGVTEVHRVLNESVLGNWSSQDPLSFEKSIVWLEPLDSLDFVREAVVDNARSRRGPLGSPNMIVLGYSKLTPDAPRDPVTGAYTRRLFYWKPSDAQRNMNDFPADAVDPRSVLPGQRGELPHAVEFDRAYPPALRRAAPAAIPGKPQLRLQTVA
ncbi:MAG: hypothetical protein KDA47_04465 [Planctomycetales bacterium]|nr:hypothetical protein [Planctomycetales bacterium]